ncbi:TIGR02186 family protein [Desulfotomaculum copahuensis]|uniref:Transmembrane protein n=1 Tax=Desulfotomaculum copahuensis TaxID=1838280 RepID=A0A1B7LD36_9FIRM|nr:TIGR02186 family protein [Desulfotomaculum copahuensis]OAT80820.1 hypothetical protein A6M21_12580 [Desulfotomaculum copahuensis]
MHVKVKTLTCLLVAMVVFLGSVPAALAGVVSVNTDPQQINVGLNFSGQTVSISGAAPADSDIYIKLVSPTRNVDLSRKGKVGPLWMNVAQAEVEGIPKMYQVFSSAKISALPPDLQDETGIEPGFKSVRDATTIKEASGNQTRKLSGREGKEYLDALIKMYQKDNLYTIKENAIQRSGDSYRLSVPLPASVAQGETVITAYAVKDGKILGQSKANINVRPVGLVGWARTMAKTNGPLYGTYAVFIALAAGLGIDMLFNYLEKLFRTLTGRLPQEGADPAAEIH